jgi:putative methionine-R-sulfoxide reductase with GAF domain
MSEHLVGRTTIGGSYSRDAMARALEDVLRLVPQAQGCGVALVVGDQLVQASGAGTFGGAAGLRVSIDASLTGLSLQSGTTMRCDDADVNPWVDRSVVQRFRVGSMVSIPLMKSDRPFGTLVATSEAKHAFSDRDTDILTEVAQSLASELAMHVDGVRQPSPGTSILS